MKSKPLILVVASLAVMMLVASIADGGLFCGRLAQRRAERRQARQAARQMSCANNLAVVHYAQPVASYGGCENCGCGQSMQVSTLPVVENVTELQPQPPAYSEPVITYAPASESGVMTWLPVSNSGTGGGQCRLINGQWRCGG